MARGKEYMIGGRRIHVPADIISEGVIKVPRKTRFHPRTDAPLPSDPVVDVYYLNRHTDEWEHMRIES